MDSLSVRKFRSQNWFEMKMFAVERISKDLAPIDSAVVIVGSKMRVQTDLGECGKS